MKIQQLMPLSDIYNREEDFSADLADNLDALRVGEFEDAATESNVSKRRADIVATGEDGTLVVENQFDEADWDHWGRLEAYARLNETTVAVLVAERFEDLMIATCNLRNAESEIGWYLIQAQANVHEELIFHHVVRPAINIQVGPVSDIGYSEFWAPIRRGEFGELFAGRPIPVGEDGWISKQIRGVEIILSFRKNRSYVSFLCKEENRIERRDEIIALFPEADYNYYPRESDKRAGFGFHVINKGKDHTEDWDEIREKLVAMATDIYNKINESDL